MTEVNITSIPIQPPGQILYHNHQNSSKHSHSVPLLYTPILYPILSTLCLHSVCILSAFCPIPQERHADSADTSGHCRAAAKIAEKVSLYPHLILHPRSLTVLSCSVSLFILYFARARRLLFGFFPPGL